jgi:hypothetical protein
MYTRFLSLVGLLTLFVLVGCGTSAPTPPASSGGPSIGTPEYERMMQMKTAAGAGASGATEKPADGQAKPADGDSKPAEEKPAEEKKE